MHPRRQEIFPFPFLSNYKLNSLWDEQNCYLYNIVTVRCHLEAINEVLQSKIVIVCQHTYKIIQGRNNLKWKNKYLQPYMNSNDFSSRVNMQISVKKKNKKQWGIDKKFPEEVICTELPQFFENWGWTESLPTIVFYFAESCISTCWVKFHENKK